MTVVLCTARLTNGLGSEITKGKYLSMVCYTVIISISSISQTILVMEEVDKSLLP